MARIITLLGSVPATMNPPIITLSPVCTKARVLMLPSIELLFAAKIVHLHQSNSYHIIHTPHDRGVITCR